ncbi:hypothetical protein AVO45_03580 [Ruegeria marisrubri]|uniref:Ysc84 actin-binding domain-containing protein n=1 Tax=Ruegeria marisrubri TaxID=1685379 RepID=A0A117KHA3_9RHOB|nr:hypothetical protein [Ruegeria marisrubri]KUJ86056.1 hypothetical protein AVO45_03580 [Ruegeria marisrubri]
MNRFLAAVFLCLVICAPVSADGLLDKIKEGAESTVGAVERGVDKAGEAIGKGVDKVEESIDSTSELISNEATPEETRARLDAMADEILARLLTENPDAKAIYEASAGYAAFDTRKVTVFPFSGGYGRGVAISTADGSRTYMNMGSGGLGAALGIGGFETQFVIFFETQADFDVFVIQGFEASAESSVMYGDDRTEQSARFVDGRSVFVLDKKGWRVAAGASGTRFWKSPELN